MAKFKIWLGVLFIFALKSNALCQCAPKIAAFPYFEDFESTDGGWFTGGIASDWAWGSPNKDVIQTAGSGANCWIVGGLTGNFYNNGQASWLQSPCFDFSSLQSPYIRFKVFWETEQGFDGANLQYSINNGASWVNVGSASTPSTCYNGNWYNTTTVSYLSPFTAIRGGWSGSVATASGNCRVGNGSGRWVTADQLLRELGGQPNVIFRFNFGAGTVCNNYNGFAIDDFTISEIPSPSGSIGFGCTGSNMFSFEFVTTLCPDTYSWDFGDPASATNNTSTLSRPVHVFSQPGTYTVTVTVTSTGSQPFTATQAISVLDLKTVVLAPAGCNNEPDGSAQAIVSGTNDLVNYRWNTEPIQYNNIATGLSPGTYQVTVSAANTCPVTGATMINNTAISVNPVVEQPGCLFSKGAIRLQPEAGGPSYQYNWLPNVSSTATAENLANGQYTVNISNQYNCSRQLEFTIATLPKPIVQIEDIQNEDCSGRYKGRATALVSSGTAPFEYNWNTVPAQTTATATALAAGNYTVTVIDSNSCTATSTISIVPEGICDDVYFAGAFTPAKITNTTFGPLGNLIAMRRYGLNIYNRFGQLVFSSNNPFEKWDGNFKNKKAAPGAYVWYCQFENKTGRMQNRKGTVILIR